MVNMNIQLPASSAQDLTITPTGQGVKIGVNGATISIKAANNVPIDGRGSQFPASGQQFLYPFDTQNNNLANEISFTTKKPSLNLSNSQIDPQMAKIVEDLSAITNESPIEQKEQAAYQFFIDQGYSKEQTAGILGNLYAESRFDLDTTGDYGLDGKRADVPTAFGLAQWRNERLDNLIAFANGKPVSQIDFEEQLNFMIHELNGKESNANQKLITSTSVEDAAAKFDKYYERSSGEHRQKRIDKALEYYNRFA